MGTYCRRGPPGSLALARPPLVFDPIERGRGSNCVERGAYRLGMRRVPARPATAETRFSASAITTKGPPSSRKRSAA